PYLSPSSPGLSDIQVTIRRQPGKKRGRASRRRGERSRLPPPASPKTPCRRAFAIRSPESCAVPALRGRSLFQGPKVFPGRFEPGVEGQRRLEVAPRLSGPGHLEKRHPAVVEGPDVGRPEAQGLGEAARR